MARYRVQSLLQTLLAVPLTAAAAALPAAPAHAGSVTGPAVVPARADPAPGLAAVPVPAVAPAPAARAPEGPARISGEVHGPFPSGWVVELFPPQAAEAAYSVRTGADGTFEFTGVEAGQYLVQARHPDSGTAGPRTPVTLRPGDNGNMTLVLDGPPPGQLPDMLAPLTGQVHGAAPDADVVVEVVHDRDGRLVQVSSAPVAGDGTFSVDPRVIEGYALPILLRAVQTLPDGSTTTVYLGQSPTPEGAARIVPADGVRDHYDLRFPASPDAPVASGTPEPTAEPTPTAGEDDVDAPEAVEEAADTGPPAALWAVLAAVVLTVAAAVAVVLRRRRS